MKRLKAELAKLKNDGTSNLRLEIEALLGVNPPKETPLAQKFLALAAAEIGKGNFEYAHDCVGAAVEAHTLKEPIELTAEFKTRLKDLGEVKASDSAFKIPLPDLSVEAAFAEAPQEMAVALADVLISAGYSKEAKKYIEAYNDIQTKKESDNMKNDKRKALLDLRAGFKKAGNFAMVKAADEMLDELDEHEAKSDDGDMPPKEDEAKGCPPDAMGDKEAKSAEEGGEMEKEADGHDMLGEQSEPQEYTTHASVKKKPTLYVEAASPKEKRLRDEAATAASRGDVRKAKVALAKADTLERSRLIAALILAGDSEMAMEGLKEQEEHAYQSKAEDGDAAKDAEDGAKDKMEHSEMPEEKTSTEEPTKEPEQEPKSEDVEKTEQETAKDLQEKVESCVKRGKMKQATAAFVALNKLEQAVVAGVKLVQGNKKLAAEGFGVWKSVSRSRLAAEAVLADHEGEDDVKEQAMEGMEMLEDESNAHEELDKALEDMDESKAEEITKDFVLPPGGKAENAPGVGGGGGAEMEHHAEEEEMEEEMEEEKEETDKGELNDKDEADAMHYEVLQSLEDVKALKVDRNALAFTFWEDDKGQSPFYVIQAAGKPVAEIHLGDQDNADEIRAYFCDEAKYTKALAQSVENTSLYEMLKNIHARFYANQVDASAYGKRMKEEAVAAVGEVRTEKLSQLRKDYTDAMLVAAEALNKGLYDKPNALKSTFVKVLAQYGILNPAIAVEAAFKEAGTVFFEQVLDGATEYLEMPKEAFVHAKKMVRQAQNVAFAQANNYSEMSIGQRLAQNSLGGLGSAPEREEAPIAASTREWNERARIDNYKSALKLSRKF